jgi:hypothetical protein
MDAGIAGGWSDFFVAAAGAAAALAGLVFVSLSINLSKIIELPSVAGRAAESIIILAGTLAASLVVLIPRLSPHELGAALLAVLLPTFLLPVWIQLRSIARRTYYRRWHAVLRALLHVTAILPGVLGAAGLLGLGFGGLGWLAFGVILSILVGISNAWVLLVEILR